MLDLKYHVVRFIHSIGLYIASTVPWFFLFLKELCYYTNAPISEDLMLTISDQNHGSHTDLKVKVSHLVLVQQLYQKP